MSGRHSTVVEAVRDMETAARDDALLAVGATSRRLSQVLGVNDTTALRYLREVIAAGHLVEIDHAGRRLLLPWPAEMESPPERWMTGEVQRGTFRLTEYREAGPAMAKIRFVSTPERLKKLMDAAVAEETAKAAKKEHEAEARQAEWDAEETRERALFAQHYPLLAERLAWFHEQVHVPGRTGLGVRLNVQENSTQGVLARVHIEVTGDRFDVLEKILGDAMGDAIEAKLRGEQG